MDYELDRLKREVDLVDYATSHGYQLDKAESGLICLIIQHPNGDKLVTGRTASGSSWYESVPNPADNGTIIEFVQTRRRKSLLAATKEISEWDQRKRTHHHNGFREEFPLTKERLAIALAVVRGRTAPSHPHLESLGLHRDTLSNLRFRGTWKVDDGGHQRVLFPHRDIEGLCGFELGSNLLSGFSEVGSKGVWQSQCDSADVRIVVTNRAVDGFSYHQIHPTARTRYLSVGSGNLNQAQPRLAELSIGFMTTQTSTVIAATSNDNAGHAIAELVRHIAFDLRLGYQRHTPEYGISWTDSLRRLCRQSSFRLRAPTAPRLER